ncbi:hypothetical protein JMUB7535_26700 [Staphylococcus aureus]
MSRGLGDVYKRQILVYVMVNLVSEKLYRLGITQIGILLKNKLTIEVGKI